MMFMNILVFSSNKFNVERKICLEYINIASRTPSFQLQYKL